MKLTDVNYCETCDHRRQEPLEINGKVDIAHWCDEFDVYVPPKGWCWQHKELKVIP